MNADPSLIEKISESRLRLDPPQGREVQPEAPPDEAEVLPESGRARPRRPRREVVGIDQRYQRHRFAGRPELPGHLEGDRPTEGIASQPVRTLRLKLANRQEVVGGHLLDPPERRQLSVQPLRLEGEHGLVGAEMASQVLVGQDVSSKRVDAEERGSGAARLNRYERLPGGRPAFLLQDRGELTDGWRIEDHREGELTVEHLFDLR